MLYCSILTFEINYVRNTKIRSGKKCVKKNTKVSFRSKFISLTNKQYWNLNYSPDKVELDRNSHSQLPNPLFRCPSGSFNGKIQKVIKLITTPIERTKAIQKCNLWIYLRPRTKLIIPIRVFDKFNIVPSWKMKRRLGK